jgi:dTDP-glucose 4,6-dehydratase
MAAVGRGAYRVLVTGGCGFIGSNLVRFLLRRRTRWEVANLDLLTYAGNRDNLADVEDDPRYRFLRGDVADAGQVRRALRGCQAVLHLAAESHVDRSIEGSTPFLRTNVIGTGVLLEEARRAGVERFVHVSTDEVYGSLGPRGRFTERTALAPNSPYAASKAGSDLLVRSFHRTHGLATLITRCSNNYGPYQFPEKFIPLMILRALESKPLPIYGDGLYVRDWIHVEDHCRALLRVLERGRAGETYNIGGNSPLRNLGVARRILALTGQPRSMLEHVVDRPGHDRRYAIDARKMERELGWRPRWTFDRGLAATVRWYRAHEHWWRRILEGRYLVRRRRAHAASR